MFQRYDRGRCRARVLTINRHTPTDLLRLGLQPDDILPERDARLQLPQGAVDYEGGNLSVGRSTDGLVNLCTRTCAQVLEDCDLLPEAYHTQAQALQLHYYPKEVRLVWAGLRGATRPTCLT